MTSMKNSNDIIGNRTRDLPACSAVPQPTVPPRTTCSNCCHHKKDLPWLTTAILTSAYLNHIGMPHLRRFFLCFVPCCGPGSSVGIATDYGLDGPGSNPGGDEIFSPSIPALGPTQPPVKWVPGLSRGKSAAGACCWPLTPFECRGQEE